MKHPSGLCRSLAVAASVVLLGAAAPAPSPPASAARDYVDALVRSSESAALAEHARSEASAGAALPAPDLPAGQALSRALGSLEEALRAPLPPAAGSASWRGLAEAVRLADAEIVAQLQESKSRLAAAGIDGEIAVRWRAAEAAYQALIQPVRRALEPLGSQAKGQDGQAGPSDGQAVVALRAEQRANLAETLRRTLSEGATLVESPSLRASLLPYGLDEPAPRPVALSPVVVPAYLAGGDAAATDLAGDTQAPLAPEIVAQASSLGFEAPRIYESVRNSIATEWYSGAMRGALGALRSRRGNDVDQASLLIALLRASSVPARYVRGVVEMPLADLERELGVVGAAKVDAVLTRAGRAHASVVRGGQIAAFQIEHTWVSALVPYSNYRGAVVDFSGKTWVPLDPSTKPSLWSAPTAVLRRMGLATGDVMDAYLTAPQTRDPLAVVRQRVEAYLAGQPGSPTYAQQLGARTVPEEHLGLLPSTLRLAVVAVTGESAALAEDQIHRVRFVARATEAADSPLILDVTLPLTEVESSRVTFSYMPATVDDHRVIDLYGGLAAVPAYLVELRPQVKVEGRLRGTATAGVAMGLPLRLELELHAPTGVSTVVRTVVAGSYEAVAFGGPEVQRRADDGGDAADSEQLAARVLSQLALGYASRWDAAEEELAALYDVALQRSSASVVFATDAVATSYVLGLPWRLDWQGVTLDAVLRVADPTPRGTAGEARDWLRMAALEGSALEHLALEDLFLIESVSADKVLALARAVGTPVDRLDATTVAQLLPGVGVSAGIKSEIENWVRLGMVVDVPRAPVRHRDWLGTAWRVEDPETGSAGYFLSGGLAGGSTSESPQSWILDYLAEALAAPYSSDPNTDPLSAASITKIAATDQQLAAAGTRAASPLFVQVRDERGRPVQGATVVFTVVSGGGLVAGSGGADAALATVTTNRLGMGVALVRVGTDTGRDPAYRLLKTSDEYPTRIGANLVEAEVIVTGGGSLAIDSPFAIYALPDAPTRFYRSDTTQTHFTGHVGRWSDTPRIAVEDRFGNPVSNIPVTFRVLPVTPDTACSNRGAGGLNATVFDVRSDGSGHLAHCGTDTPTPQRCGGPLLVQNTSDKGAAAGMILGSSAAAAYTLRVDAAGLAALVFQYSLIYVQDSTTGECRAASDLTIEGGPRTSTEAGSAAAAARSGTAYAAPLPIVVGYFVPDFEVRRKSDGSFYRFDFESGDWSLAQAQLNVVVSNGGSASPVVELTYGRYQTAVTTGVTPGPNDIHVTARSVFYSQAQVNRDTGAVGWVRVSHPGTLEKDLGRIWGVDPVFDSVVPSPIGLSSDDRTTSAVQFLYDIRPHEYQALAAEVDLTADLAFVGTVVGTSRSGVGAASLQRGYAIDISEENRAQIVLNRGSVSEVRSGYFQLPLDQPQRLFTEVDESVDIAADVDIPNQRYCLQPAKFHFAMSRAAKVTLAFTPVRLTDQGLQPTGIPISYYGNDLSEGPHDLDLLPGTDLPAGLYTFKLTGQSGSDASPEIVEGTARSEFRSTNTLPLGHTLVEAVDIFNGSLAIEREDFSIPGRVLPLAFSRSYSTSAGGNGGPMGMGWTHTWDSHIHVTGCGDLTLSGGDGGGQTFVDDGHGGLRPLRGFHGSLVANAADHGFDFYPKAGLRYHYDFAGVGGWNLGWIEDPNGNRITLAYEASSQHGQARVAAVTDDAGRRLGFHYLTREFVGWKGDVIVRVDGPEGIRVDFSYDKFGNLVRASREPQPEATAPSRDETYTYEAQPGQAFDDRQALVAVRDALSGAETRYTHDQIAIYGGDNSASASGVPSVVTTSVRSPRGGVRQFDFDEAALMAGGAPTTTVPDRRGHPRVYAMNAYGVVVREEDALQHATLTDWDMDHLLPRSQTDANGRRTDWTYDEFGNVLTETREVLDANNTPQPLTRTFTYVPPSAFTPPFLKERVATRTDRKGATTTFGYDAKGNLRSTSVAVADVDGRQNTVAAENTYLPNGDLHTNRNGRGLTTTFTHDAFGYVTETLDARHGKRTETRNARGLKLTSTDENGHRTSFGYDRLGRPTSTDYPTDAATPAASVSVSYDDVARTRTETDARGHATVTHFDPDGNAVRLENAAGGAKEIEYDLEGNKTLESSWFDGATPRHDTTFEYDDANRLKERLEPLSKLTVLGYDGVGNVVSQRLTGPAGGSFTGRETRFAYDALDRRVETRRLFELGESVVSVRYDGEGNVVLQRDPLGHETSARFDALDRKIEEVGEPWRAGQARTVQWLYDANGNKTEERRKNERRKPDGSFENADQVRTWSYDELDRAIRAVDAEGKATLYEHDAVGNVVREINPRLAVKLHEYDARNRRIRTREPLDRFTVPPSSAVSEWGYDGNGNVVAEHWTNDNVVSRTYDELNRLTVETDAVGPRATLGYDARGNRVTERDANDNLTSNTFDALDRVVAQDLPEARYLAFEYDVAGNQTGVTDARQHTTSFQYDQLDRRVRSLDPAPFAYTASWAYDVAGNLLRETDRRGNTTEHAYDALNRRISTTAPAPFSYTQSWTYDALGNVLTATDRRGIVTEQSFDRENRVLAKRRAGVLLEGSEYDGAGNRLFATDANGNVTGFEYDERNLLLAENRSLAAITHFTRDAMGDVVAQTDPELRQTLFGYDLRRRKTSETRAMGSGAGDDEVTSFTYDGNGNLLTKTLPLGAGHAWTYGYDSANRLDEVTDPVAGLTKYGYDKNGNRTLIEDAERQPTTFAFDELNRLTSKTYVDDAVERYGYDENGNQTSVTDPKVQLFAFEYDALNRQTLATYPRPQPATADDVVSIATTYDPNDNPLVVTETWTASPESRTTAHQYDNFDRLLSVTDRYGKAIGYGYDANGNRTSLTDPDHAITRYGFDALNRLTSVNVPGAGVTTYAYYKDSRLKKVAYPNTASETTTYDLAGRIATLENASASGGLLSRFEYQLDKNGNRTQQVEIRGASAPETTTYGYDAADRLTLVAYPDKTVATTYDKVGDRLTEKVTQGSTTVADKAYTYNARHELEHIADAAEPAAATTYAYDSNGNQTSKTTGGVTTLFAFDVRDQLTSVNQGASLLGSYQYDFKGLRILKQGSLGFVRYTYDDTSVLAESDVSGVTLSKYEYGPDRLLSMNRQGEGRRFYLFDALRSVTDLTAPDGSLQTSYQYDAWGNPRGTVGVSFNRFGFTGHERDGETGLYYFKARFYEPETGRFLSEDPADGKGENPPSLWRYAYAYANPTVYWDPDGRANLTSAPSLWKALPDPEIGAAAARSAEFAGDEAVGAAEFVNSTPTQIINLGQTTNSTLGAVGSVGKGLADCVSAPSVCYAVAKEFVSGLPEKVSKSIEEYVDTPAPQHGKAWGGALAAGATVFAGGASDFAPVPELPKGSGPVRNPSVDGAAPANSVPKVAVENPASPGSALKSQAPGPVTEDAVARVNRNSRAYEGDSHVYVVRNPDDSLYKVGKSSRGVKVSDGASIRAEQQVRRLNRAVGPGHTSEIRKTFKTSGDALDYEKKVRDRFRRMHGDDQLPGNREHLSGKKKPKP